VVIGNLDIKSMSILPSETDPILVVDADAVLTRSITLRRLKPICWWRRKIPEFIRAVDLNQPSKRQAGNSLKCPDSPLLEDRLSILIPKGTDQTTSILRSALDGLHVTGGALPSAVMEPESCGSHHGSERRMALVRVRCRLDQLAETEDGGFVEPS
jgi:hypothetical protein